MTSCTSQCALLPASAADWIAELTVTRLYLNPDQRYRGSCILVFRRHAVEVTELPLSEYEALWSDVRRAAGAVQHVCRPIKLNIATLGNLVPHLHVHVIPRAVDDAAWPQAIWAHPLPPVALAPSDKLPLIEQLRNSLSW